MLVSVDGSQLEWRAALELSGDQVGLQEILNKEDTHSKNQDILKLPTRLIAKRFLFRTIFRGSGYAFANDPDFMHVSSNPKFWDTANQTFYEKYHGLDKKHREWEQTVISGKPIIGPLGRFWHIDMVRDRFGELKSPMPVLTNYPVQGSSADVMMIARISFFNRLKKAGLDKIVLIISSVHDSIYVDCPSKYIQTVVNMFYQVFDDLPANILKVFGYKWTVPLECECKFGPNMKDQTKIQRNDK